MTITPPETPDPVEEPPDRPADDVDEDRLSGYCAYDTAEAHYVGPVSTRKRDVKVPEGPTGRYVVRKV